MSIIQAIQERQSQGVSQQVAAMDQQAAEAAMPDAGVTARTQRKAHGQALREVPDQAMQEVEAGPEEQNIHMQLEKSMIEMIHGKGMTPKLLKAIFAGGDVVRGVGNVASDIVQKLKSETPGATEEILASIGERTIEEIVELAELADPRVDLTEDDMAEALSIGIQNYMKNNANEVDDDEVRGFLANGQ